MARYNPSRDIEPLLDAAQRWVQSCLVQQGSLFSEKSLWTPDVLDQVRAAFTDNPDESDASFFEKLEGQMGASSSEAKQLMAELLWVLMLFQTNIRPVKKRESIGRVWAWSGESLGMEHPLLTDAVLSGVGSPGTAYNTQRWRELNYVIGLARDIAGRSRSERESLLGDRDRFEQWIEKAPQQGYRQFRHLFRYLAFPDQNERISLNRDRRLILEAYTDFDRKTIKEMSDAKQDDALASLREKLKVKHGLANVDFYEPTFARRWRKEKGDRKGGKVGEFATGFAELKARFLHGFPDFSNFSQHANYIEQERNYKDELVDLFARDVEPAIGVSDWNTAGAAAIALLRRPLKNASGKVQNIVGWRYADLLNRLDPAGVARFGRALGELTDETVDVGPRVERFVEALVGLAGSRQRVLPAAQRSITGFYLALSDPSHHLFLKTNELQRALRFVDPAFQWSSERLTGQDVDRVETLAHQVLEQLQLEGWEPQDLLDVQGFLWVAANNGDRVEEATEEDEERAMEQKSSDARESRPPLNQILFGPPGTGKTFHSINKALEILDPRFLALHGRPEDRMALKERFDELVQARRIRFVTFHQSFSYEDFVEGLRADSDEEGKLRYRVEPGVFKTICDDARGSAQVASDVGIREGARIWKLSIDGTVLSATRDFCFSHGEARIGWGEVGDLRNEHLISHPEYQNLGSNDRNTLHAFSNEIEPGDVVLCIGSATHVQAIGVVQGEYEFQPSVPPGVRQDYANVLPVRWLATGLALDLRALNGGVRFTLKTVYEITRFGWPELADVIEAASIRLKGSTHAVQQHPLDHVLIIDEINRGNISRIFGELITLIEPSKRAGAAEQIEVVLPYSKKPFMVPRNVYLVGTMNTADRSLAGLDIALRRRFEFVEMPPRPEFLKGVHVAEISLQELLTTMNQRIEALLDKDHQLGHAYFMSLHDGDDLASLATIFRNQVLPLLQEYFFEDWQRIAWVLNDHRKPEGARFIVATGYDSSSLFGHEADAQGGAKLWQLDQRAFNNPESYRGIIQVAQD